MSEKLIQVTSTAVLLNNDIRISWQGFRPASAEDKKPTTYFTTLPGNGTGSTDVSMEVIGAQASDYPVEVILLSGEATLDGTPLNPNSPVMLPGVGSGDPARLVYTSETCSLQVSPKNKAESGGAMRMNGGGGGENNPPPPYPGGGHNH